MSLGGIMAELRIEMPLVKNCNVKNCVYNTDQHCHAKAITIGDGINPECDTYLNHSIHAGPSTTAGVGACKVSNCKFNKDFECSAAEISVGEVAKVVKCLTYVSS